jgi:hypothetical protein
MTTSNFLLAMMVGSALIAFWFVARFPDKAPTSFRTAMIHIGAALVVGWVTPALFGVVLSMGHQAAFAAVFGVLLPTGVYIFLATAWFLKIVHDTISHYRHQ